MLKLGDKDLRKRWRGDVNVNTIHLGTTNIWPYIIDVTKSAWSVSLSTKSLAASGGTITVTSITRNVKNTWVNFIGTSTEKYFTNNTETLENYTVTTDIGSVDGNKIIVPYNPNTSDRTINITITSSTGEQIKTTATQTKNVVTYGSWTLTLSVSPTEIPAAGGTATITSKCSRTYTNSNGQAGGTENSTVTLSTNVGSISGTTLTIGENATTEDRTITVTATAQGLTKTATLSQMANVNYTYYAVTTDAYAVTVQAKHQIVPGAPDGAPTDSYHYGTVVFAIADGPATAQANFTEKDYDLGNYGGLQHILPIPQTRANGELSMRFALISNWKLRRKLMKVPASINLTGYATRDEAISNAPTAMCTITDSGIRPFATNATIISDDATVNLVSRTTAELYTCSIYDVEISRTDSDRTITLKAENSYSGVTNSSTFSFRQLSTLYGSDDTYNRVGIINLDNNTTKFALFKEDGPDSGLTFDDCAIKYDGFTGSNWVKDSAYNFTLNTSAGLSTTPSYGDSISIFEWNGSWNKIGDFTLTKDAVQAFVFRDGISNSLNRVLYYAKDGSNGDGGDSGDTGDKKDNIITVQKESSSTNPNECRIWSTTNVASTITVQITCTWNNASTTQGTQTTHTEILDAETYQTYFIPNVGIEGDWELTSVNIDSISPTSDDTYNYTFM